jgi:hypothetical protein
MSSNGPVIIDSFRIPLSHFETVQSMPYASISAKNIEPFQQLQLPKKPIEEHLPHTISRTDLLGFNLDEETPQQILDKYDEIQKSRTTWSKRFTSMKRGIIDISVWTLTLLEGAFSYTSKGLEIISDPAMNLIKNLPKLSASITRFVQTVSLPVGIFSGVVGLITAPYILFKMRNLKNTVEKHIHKMEEPTAIKLSDRQFIEDLQAKLKDPTASMDEIRDWFSQQSGGLQLDTVLQEMPSPIKQKTLISPSNEKTKKEILKKFKNPSNINFALSQRDSSFSQNYVAILRARVNTTYDYVGQLKIINNLFLAEDISIVSLYESLSGQALLSDKEKPQIEEYTLLKQIIDKLPRHDIKELMEKIDLVKDDPLLFKKEIMKILVVETNDLQTTETKFARRFAHIFLDICEENSQQNSWRDVSHNRIVMFTICHDLGLQGISLDPNMTLAEFKEKIETDEDFIRQIEFTYHAKQQSVSKIQQMLTSRQKQEVKRLQNIKESPEYQKSFDSISALFNQENVSFKTICEAFSSQHIDITKLPSSEDENFETFTQLHEYLEELEEGLKVKDLPEERAITLLQERGKTLQDIHALSITKPISDLDAIKEYIESPALLNLMQHVGAFQKSRVVETLSALSRNGLKEVSKEKAKRERKFFNFNWIETKVMAPIGFSMSIISITVLALIAIGAIASAPVWLSPLGWAVFGLGVTFALAGLIHQIRNKPRTLYESVIKLRGVRKFFRNIPFKFHGWILDRKLQKLRYAQIVQKLISLKKSDQDVQKMIEHLDDISIPKHLRKILETDFNSLKDSVKSEYLKELQEEEEDYSEQIIGLKNKIRKKNMKVKKLKAKLQKHIDKLQEAGMKDAILGGYKIEDRFKKKKPNRLWKEIGLNFDKFVQDKSQLQFDANKERDPIRIADALLTIDQAGGLDPELKEIMMSRMGINVDNLKKLDKGKIIDFNEQLPKELEAFFGSSIGNIFQVAKKMESTPKFSSIYY